MATAITSCHRRNSCRSYQCHNFNLFSLRSFSTMRLSLVCILVLLCFPSIALSIRPPTVPPTGRHFDRPHYTPRSGDTRTVRPALGPSTSTTHNNRYANLKGTTSSSPPPPPPPGGGGSSASPTNYSTVDVYDYGAVGDGKTDNTAAFQAAINAAASAGGGTVAANRGHFLFTGSLTLPEGVTLEGTYAVVPSHAMAGSTTLPPITGTLLMPTAGRGNESAQPFITLHRDSTVKGLVIYYPQQPPTAYPTPFPWTLDLTADNSAVIDVECLNCYNFIRAVSSGRHYIARVQGQPIHTGLLIDETYDIGRVEDVHFNPWYSTDKTYMSHQLLYGRAFVVARSDWEYFFNTFAFGYAVGYHFIESETGSCNGNFLGIGADMCVNASVHVDNCDTFGVLITNGEFTSFLDPQFGNLTAGVVPTQLVVSASNTGSVRLVNSAFWGPSVHVARVDGSGSVGFGDCIFSQWDAGNKGAAAIAVNGTGSVSVRGCDFQQNSNQMVLGDGVDRAVIVGNLIRGKQRFAGVKQTARMQVGLNAADD